jgi:hypothetical protein
MCHFTIACTAAAAYYVVSRKIPVLVEHAVFCGLLYGEAVFLFMCCRIATLGVRSGSIRVGN